MISSNFSLLANAGRRQCYYSTTSTLLVVTRASTSCSWQSGYNTPPSWSAQCFRRGAVLTDVLTTSSVQMLSLEPPVFIAVTVEVAPNLAVHRIPLICSPLCLCALTWQLLWHTSPPWVSMSKEKYLLFVLSPIEKDGDQFIVQSSPVSVHVLIGVWGGY